MGFAGSFAAPVIGFFFSGCAGHANALLIAIAAALTTCSALQTLVGKYPDIVFAIC
jgi:hypothetical protein